MNTKSIVIAAALLAFAGSAFATDSSEQAARLESARQRVAAGAQSVKPNQASRMRAEADKLQGLIDQIQAGKKVDPQEVDRAIQRTYQGY